MTARTHDAFAFATLVTVAAYYPPGIFNLYTLFASIVGNQIGGLIPDLDDAGNKLWELLPGGEIPGRFFSRIFYKHRTITHSLVGLFLVYKALEWGLPKLFNPEFIDPNILLWSIVLGYISHLLADGLTEEGVPLLFPFRFNFGFPPIAPMRIRTGGWFEKFVVLPGLGVYLVWFINSHQTQLLEIIRQVR